MKGGTGGYAGWAVFCALGVVIPLLLAPRSSAKKFRRTCGIRLCHRNVLFLNKILVPRPSQL
jgi:hypothetical protein